MDVTENRAAEKFMRHERLWTRRFIWFAVVLVLFASSLVLALRVDAPTIPDASGYAGQGEVPHWLDAGSRQPLLGPYGEPLMCEFIYSYELDESNYFAYRLTFVVSLTCKRSGGTHASLAEAAKWVADAQREPRFTECVQDGVPYHAAVVRWDRVSVVGVLVFWLAAFFVFVLVYATRTFLL